MMEDSATERANDQRNILRHLNHIIESQTYQFENMGLVAMLK